MVRRPWPRARVSGVGCRQGTRSNPRRRQAWRRVPGVTARAYHGELRRGCHQADRHALDRSRGGAGDRRVRSGAHHAHPIGNRSAARSRCGTRRPGPGRALSGRARRSGRGGSVAGFAPGVIASRRSACEIPPRRLARNASPRRIPIRGGNERCRGDRAISSVIAESGRRHLEPSPRPHGRSVS